ncbi:MAG: dUTP diphosphatase [Alphaproteobacteria bacterium]|jgi:dUTP pyrophosphatase
MPQVIVKIKKLHSNVNLPNYQTEQSAGVDLEANITENIVIRSGKRELISTGLAIELPRGFEAQIRPRSGLALKNGITVLNSPGTIDADYRGEIKVLLINLGEEDFTIIPKMRIAQMIIAPFTRADFQEEIDLTSSQRGTGGFGSTGV